MTKVLLVEDDPALAAMVIEALTDDGHEVRHSTDVEALLWARARWPDVVVLDLMLEPYLSGAAILSYLHNHPRTKHIPVILATGVQETAPAFALGTVTKMQKPYDLDTLLSAIEHVPEKGEETA